MCVDEGYVLDDRGETQIPQAGGHTFVPIVGWHKDINCYDYKSLYPSIIEAHNLCYTTLIHPDDYHKYSEDQYTVYEWTDEEDKKKGTVEHHHHYRIIKKEIYFGIMPRMVHMLVHLRRKVQAQIRGLKTEVAELKSKVKELNEILSSCQDEEQISEIKAEIHALNLQIKKLGIRIGLLDKKQWALKILVNSAYGFVSAQGNKKKKKPRGKKPCAELGIITCWVGRSAVDKTSKYVNEKYGHYVVYGDTDSVMICQNFENTLEAVRTGDEYAKELTTLFPPPMEYEFEKCMIMICVTKKRYVYFMADSKGKYHITLKNMIRKGVTSNRRDNCKFATETFDLVAINGIKQIPVEEVYQIMFDAVCRSSSKTRWHIVDNIWQRFLRNYQLN